VCAACPVRQDCMQDALLDVVEDGIWGGAGEGLRRHLRALLVASPHPERIFVPGCRCPFHKAWREHWARLDTLRRTGRRAEGQVNFNGRGATHGKASTRARGCTCALCKAARKKPPASSAPINEGEAS